MAKSAEKPDDHEKTTGENGPQSQPASEPGSGLPAAQGRQAPQAAQPAQIEVDDTHAIAAYANFCRVTGTPEELIIDFGLNEHPFGAQAHPIRITQRIITNFYTAKRLLHVLNMTIQRHEAAFGVLETDVQRRVRPAAARPQGPTG
jgi:hypothetical protein